MSHKKSYYDILGVGKSASIDDIRKAYKKMAVKWHPDKNLDKPEESAEMFKAIAEAYDTLSDPAKRRNYDAGGDGAAFERRASREAERESRGGDFHSRFDDRRAFDIFEHFFSQMNAEHDDVFADPFFSRVSGRSGGSRGAGGSPLDAFFGRGFGSGFGAGFQDDFSGMGSVMSSSSTSSYSSFSSGSGRTGTSTSTSTVIGPDGRKVTKKTTTTYKSDGTSETRSEEFEEQVPVRSSLAYDNGNRGIVKKPSRGYF